VALKTKFRITFVCDMSVQMVSTVPTRQPNSCLRIRASATGGFFEMWDNRSNPLNVINLLFFCFDNHLKPAMDFHGLTDAPLFNRCAPQKELRVRFCNHSNALSNDSVLSNTVFPFLCGNDAKQASFPSVAFTRTTSLARNGSTG